MLDYETYHALGLDQLAPTAVNGRDRSDFVVSLNAPGDACYHPCPEAYPGPEIPTGELISVRDWNGARVFPNTLRDVRIYLPPGAPAGEPLNLVVFQDGNFYLPRQGAVRASLVLDSLHAKGEIAPTAAVFVDPGRPPGSERGDEIAVVQRSLEYDSITEAYGRFLIEDLLPFAAQHASVRFTDDPARRTLVGISSGGICSFVGAWHFPDRFGRVLSHCGSFVNIRGGHNLESLVRKTTAKPIRVFLQSGAADARYITGDWPLANEALAAALEFARYDYRFAFGVGGHSLRHGGAIFADTLRWLWRD